ncbi:unnamed protein product [Ophioblennius macclurei]
MGSLLKLVVILYCVQSGENRWLGSPIDKRRETVSAHVSPAAEEQSDTEASGSRPVPDAILSRRPRRRRSAEASPCSLRSILLQVQDLGLGYDSDETILFKYCGGTCPHMRSNHDLALSNLLLSGTLPHPVPGELWHSAPCCRPTHHEDMAFLDNSHRWHKVEKLSAAGCSCVD